MECNLLRYFCSSYPSIATREAAAVPTLAKERKVDKYVALSNTHAFTPVATETFEVFE